MRRIQRLTPGFLVGLLFTAVVLGTALYGPAGSQGLVASTRADAGDGDTAAKPAGEGHEGGHTEVFTIFLLALGVVVLVAMVGRWLASRFHQPAVLGELLIGVLVGNVGYWLGIGAFSLIMHLGDAGP